MAVNAADTRMQTMPALGAIPGTGGTHFSLFSEHAEKVELLLFETAQSSTPRQAISMHKDAPPVWHAHVPDIGPGQLYAFRVYGPFDPSRSLYMNPGKVLLDPYARAIAGDFIWNDALYPYRREGARTVQEPDLRDSAPFVPKCVVIDAEFDWGADKPPATPWDRTIIYETHLKSFTAKCPFIPEPLRGTYAGMGSPGAVDYLKKLGITAVEFLPLQHHADEKMIVDRGLRNYWGYATIGFFAPDFRFSSSGCLGSQVNEFKQMVKSFHEAGIEVILDVVYNHTPEGNDMGPVLCFKGIDAPSYYLFEPGHPNRFVDYTGTGNTLAVEHPWVLRMVLDSLRYWVSEMHVDGFRFDLAVTLGREQGRFNRQAAFFRAIAEDPILSRVKMIAEPWDLGPDGYQVGGFPPPWREWNDKFRDVFRQFWNGYTKDHGLVFERSIGSRDVFLQGERGATASINYVSCHDGFTLADLLSYNQKHNEANLEGNQDGSLSNYSINYGQEGPASDPALIDLRFRQAKNLLLSLFFSQGIPMLLGGDEMARTQRGNNNAYCHDDEINYFQWELNPNQEDLLLFVKDLVQVRRKHGSIKGSPKMLRITPVVGNKTQRIAMAALGIRWKALAGKQCIQYALLFNAEPDPVRFHLISRAEHWKQIISTGKPVVLKSPESAVVEGRCTVLLCRGK